MTISNKSKLIAMLLGIFYAGAISPCIGWFNIGEYAKEVGIIQDYITQQVVVDHSAHKVFTWLEKRIAMNDISPQCLIAIADLVSNKEITEHKKIKKLQYMMEHDKLTRVNDELALVKQELENSRQREYVIAQRERQVTHKNASDVQQQEFIANFEKKFEERREEEAQQAATQEKAYFVRLAKEMAILGVTLIISMPLAVAGIKIAEGLAKNYVDSWNKKA